MKVYRIRKLLQGYTKKNKIPAKREIRKGRKVQDSD